MHVCILSYKINSIILCYACIVIQIDYNCNLVIVKHDDRTTVNL